MEISNRQFELLLKECESINLKRLKLNTLLLVVHFLISDYEKPQLLDEKDSLFVDDSISKLKEYIEENIIVSNSLVYLYKNRHQTALLNALATKLEPMKAYYIFLTNIFKIKLTKGSNWLPELLGFSLIYNYKKEFEKSFVLHPFIEDFPIEEIIEIYNKNNIELKKEMCEEEKLNLWKIKTPLDNMYDLSEFMIKKYMEFNFKINPKRVSKSRKKR